MNITRIILYKKETNKGIDKMKKWQFCFFAGFMLLLLSNTQEILGNIKTANVLCVSSIIVFVLSIYFIFQKGLKK